MTDEQRLSKHIVFGECWEWSGWRLPSGYGTLRLRNRGQRGKTMLAHRLAYETWVGPIPEGADVLHRCDNPPCIRPEHLFHGTQATNAADMAAKGRGATTHRENRHLTDDDRREIIRRRDAGEGRAAVARAFSVTESYVSMLTGPRRHRYQARA